MPDESVRDPALDYFYFGFYRALRRFRASTVTGWCVTGAGIAALALRWDSVWRGDLTGGILCGLLIGAGILLVQQGVTELSQYTEIPFPHPRVPGGSDAEGRTVTELAGLMEEVGKGGWQEAVHALATLRAVGEQFGLPDPGEMPRTSAADRTRE
jgi:hypothetical protein